MRPGSGQARGRPTTLRLPLGHRRLAVGRIPGIRQRKSCDPSCVGPVDHAVQVDSRSVPRRPPPGGATRSDFAELARALAFISRVNQLLVRLRPGAFVAGRLLSIRSSSQDKRSLRLVRGFVSTVMSKAACSSFLAMCARNTIVRRLLVAAIVCVPFSSQAQARPLGIACIYDCSLVQSSIAWIALDGKVGGGVDVLPTGANPTSFGSILQPPSPFRIHIGEPDQILFSLTTHKSETAVVAVMRHETLRAGIRETALDAGAGRALGEHNPQGRSTALLLISSGIAGLAAASRRRRGVRQLLEVQVPWTSRKEVSDRASIVPLLFAPRSSHSTPLRI